LEDLEGRLDLADASLSPPLDVGRFHTSMDEAMVMLSCLEAPLTPAVAHELHRLTVLRRASLRNGVRVEAPVERRTSRTLAAVSGGAVVTSAVFYGLAWQSRSAFVQQPAVSAEEVRGAAARTNTLAATSLGFVAVAAGTGISAVVVGQW